MPHLVRVGLRLERWFTQGITWLAPNEVPAVALSDLHAQDNELSFFALGEGIDVDRIVVAVVAKRRNPTETDVGYAVFEVEEEAARALGIRIEKQPGETPDAEVNDLHYNVEHLTARQLAELASAIARGTLDSVLPKRIGDIVRKGLLAGTLDQEQLDKKFLAVVRR